MKVIKIALIVGLALFSFQSLQAAKKKPAEPITLEQYLAKAEQVAKNKGRDFNERKVTSRFKRMDTNSDGILTAEERVAFAEKRKK